MVGRSGAQWRAPRRLLRSTALQRGRPFRPVPLRQAAGPPLTEHHAPQRLHPPRCAHSFFDETQLLSGCIAHSTFPLQQAFLWSWRVCIAFCQICCSGCCNFLQGLQSFCHNLAPFTICELQKTSTVMDEYHVAVSCAGGCIMVCHGQMVSIRAHCGDCLSPSSCSQTHPLPLCGRVAAAPAALHRALPAQ